MLGFLKNDGVGDALCNNGKKLVVFKSILLLYPLLKEGRPPLCKGGVPTIRWDGGLDSSIIFYLRYNLPKLVIRNIGMGNYFLNDGING